MQLDQTNVEFNRAFKLVTETNRNVFLTGRAGTGKTTFLKYLKENCSKSMAIVAPTGIAAINAGGMTIHSLFQIKPGFIAPDTLVNYEIRQDKKNLLQGIDLLIIDEVSMVRIDLLDMLEKTCRAFGKSEKPFGGKQLLFIGDPYQLPSFVNDNERDVFLRFYDSFFFFKSKSFWDCKPIPIELKKIYRQNERTFIDLLNKIRVNNINETDLDLLNSKFVRSTFQFAEQGYLYLGTTNDQVGSINESELNKVPNRLFEFKGNILRNIFSRQNARRNRFAIKGWSTSNVC